MLSAEQAPEWDKECIHLNAITTFFLTEEKYLLCSSTPWVVFMVCMTVGIFISICSISLSYMRNHRFFFIAKKISFYLWYERSSSHRVDWNFLNMSHVYFTRWLKEVSLAPACLSFTSQLVYGFSQNSFDHVLWNQVWSEMSQSHKPRLLLSPCCQDVFDGCVQAPSWQSPWEEIPQVLS